MEIITIDMVKMKTVWISPSIGMVSSTSHSMDLYSYKATRECINQEMEVCVSAPVTMCDIAGSASSTKMYSNHLLRDDFMSTQSFIQQNSVVSHEKKVLTDAEISYVAYIAQPRHQLQHIYFTLLYI